MNDSNKYQSLCNNKNLNNIYYDINGNPEGFKNPSNLSDFDKHTNGN